jgi:hypothetical protein
MMTFAGWPILAVAKTKDDYVLSLQAGAMSVSPVYANKRLFQAIPRRGDNWAMDLAEVHSGRVISVPVRLYSRLANR